MNRIITKLRTLSPLASRTVVIVLLLWILTPERSQQTNPPGARFFKNASEQLYVPLDPNKGNSPTTASKTLPLAGDRFAFQISVELSGKIVRAFQHVAPVERNPFYSCISINAP